MPKVRFKKAGRWADPEPHIPQVEANVGDEVNVSPRLAVMLLEAGAAELVPEEKPTEGETTKPRLGKKSPRRSPPLQDKDAGEY